jgi:hypothetical protein
MIFLDRANVRALATLFLFAAAARGQVSTIQIAHDVVVEAEASDQFTWKDSSNQPRVAVLAHNDIAAGSNGSRGGALRQFQYHLPDGSTRIATITTYGNSGFSGFGYVVGHSNAPPCVGGDDSPLGFKIAGNWQRIFEGRHHAIFRFTQNYQRNCPNVIRTIPVTIDWIFVTGRDNPVYAITWDVAAAGPNAPEGTFNDDSRAPYGELNIDGDGNTDIDGVAWGDRRKFTSTSSPVTLSSSWTYNVLNTVPYVKEWIAGPLDVVTHFKDATMGLVQTQTMTQQDAGDGRNPFYHDISVLWDKTSDTTPANRNGYVADCPYAMPCQNEWAYQANADSIGIGISNNNARLTWGTQFGFIGQHTYDANDGTGVHPPGYPKKSYSTYIVLGTHSSSPVEAQVTQVETVQSLTLTAANGSVVLNGPAGVAEAGPVNYAPAGYNHIYGALAFSANGNQLDANIAVGAGTLKKPLIIISNFTSAAYPTVKLGGVTLVSDVDYFPSLRAAANELWITLNRDLVGAVNHLEIIPVGGPAVPTGLIAAAFSQTRVDLNWNVVVGADSYQVDRKSPGGGFVQIATPVGNAFSDITAMADTAYLYRVRAVNGAGTSGNSLPDLATTVIFFDAPLDGVVVQARHLSQLRTAVDAVRMLAGQGIGGYTDAAAAGTIIKAVHVTELRLAIDAARGALGLPTPGYTDAAPGGLPIKAVHFQELRDRVQ